MFRITFEVETASSAASHAFVVKATRSGARKAAGRMFADMVADGLHIVRMTIVPAV